jgi:type I restriction enzyme S subunit
VTRGLDPEVPMKASDVEWLGEIPTHWQVGPLKYQTNFVNGAAFKPTDWGDEGTPIIRIENLNGGGNFNRTSHGVDPRYHIREGDLLFAWSGNRGTSFGPFIWRKKGLHYLNQHIFRLAQFQCEPSWFYWVLKGVTAYVEKQAHGIIGLVHITKQELGSVKVPLIPREEQHAIADHLDREMDGLDALVGKAQEHIEKLREYRTALISAAVTGKIDVREEASAPVGREPDKMMR